MIKQTFPYPAVSDAAIEAYLANTMGTGKLPAGNKFSLTRKMKARRLMETHLMDPFLVAVHMGVNFDLVAKLANDILSVKSKEEGKKYQLIPESLKAYLALTSYFAEQKRKAAELTESVKP